MSLFIFFDNMASRRTEIGLNIIGGGNLISLQSITYCLGTTTTRATDSEQEPR